MLQNPVFLWALAGILIPLIIHLWNRHKAKVIPVGSIRWFMESQNTRINNLQFHDWLLFLLRALLILLFTSLLLEFNFPSQQPTEENKEWLCIDPALLSDSLAMVKIKEEVRAGKELHLFKKDFPKADTVLQKEKEMEANLNYWSYLPILAKSRKDNVDISVLSYPDSKYFQGKRPSIPFKVNWILLPFQNAKFYIAQASKQGTDSIRLQIGINEEKSSRFEAFNLPSKQTQYPLKGLPLIKKENDSIFFADTPTQKVKIQELDILEIGILYQKEFEADAIILESALNVIRTYTSIEIKTEKKILQPKEEFNGQGKVVFVLSKDSFKFPQNRDQKLIRYQEGRTEDWFTPDEESPNTWHLNKRLHPILNQEIYKGDFPAALIQVLFEKEEIRDRIKQYAEIPFDLSQMNAKYSEQINYGTMEENKRSSSLDLFLWIILTVVFAVERGLSYQKRN